MLTLPSILLGLVLGGPPATQRVDLERVPRVAGRADVSVWRSAIGRSFVHNQGGRPVFVRARDDAGRAVLRRLGIKPSRRGWFFTRMDRAALLSALQAGGRIEVRRAPAHRPLVVVSAEETGVSAIRTGVGLDMPRQGRGVLIGIVDTGVDLHHPAFRNPDGSCRVVAVWDQDAATGRAPRGFDYGHECDRATILAERCIIGDPQGHGTHVSGIAAGSGTVQGVAGQADIAVVRSDAFTRLADAVAYLIDLGNDRGQPVVVNISVGGHYGPHDGRTPLEEYLGELAGQGRLVVAAAGNDGRDRIHVRADLDDTPRRVELNGLPQAGAAVDTIVELWSDSTRDVALALELWLDGEPVVEVPLAASDTEMLHGGLTHEGSLLCEISYGVDYVTEHQRTRRSVVIDFSRARPLPRGGRLALRMSGQGVVSGWISQSDYSSGGSRFGSRLGTGWIAGDGLSSITVPATSPRIIAVGSYTVRLRWHSEYAGEQTLVGLTNGMLAPYSSVGPTSSVGFTGIKPDLTAPGTVIISARAISVRSGANTVDEYLSVMQGTSMAAPHVAGILALMLEVDPRLGPERARQILVQTTRADAHTGKVPNDAWGHGKVDALAAIQETEEQARGCAATPGAAGYWLGPVAILLLRRRRKRAGAGAWSDGL